MEEHGMYWLAQQLSEQADADEAKETAAKA